MKFRGSKKEDERGPFSILKQKDDYLEAFEGRNFSWIKMLGFIFGEKVKKNIVVEGQIPLPPTRPPPPLPTLQQYVPDNSCENISW